MTFEPQSEPEFQADELNFTILDSQTGALLLLTDKDKKERRFLLTPGAVDSLLEQILKDPILSETRGMF